jgi:hypothetical protein
MAESTLFPGVALVTGAAGTGEYSTFSRHDIYEQDTNNKIGIGAVVAKTFPDAGCPRIAIADLNEKLLQDTKKVILESHPKG